MSGFNNLYSHFIILTLIIKYSIITKISSIQIKMEATMSSIKKAKKAVLPLLAFAVSGFSQALHEDFSKVSEKKLYYRG